MIHRELLGPPPKGESLTTQPGDLLGQSVTIRRKSSWSRP